MGVSLLTHVGLAASALAAGVVNAIAGGGTLLTFPALMSVTDAVTANATSGAAVVPGSLASAVAFRDELRPNTRWLLWLLGPSVVGATVGTLLVTELPPSVFAHLVPWLVLTAAVLFSLQPTLARRFRTERPVDEMPSPTAMLGLVMFQFVIGIYGGYFGAGIGILMIAALSYMGVGDIHRVNGVKAFLAAAVNGTSVIVFAARGRVDWSLAPAMAAAAVLGGYFGARVSRRMPAAVVRGVVIVIGFGLAGYYFVKQMTAA